MKLFKNILFLGGILASLLSGCSPDNNSITKEEIESVGFQWGDFDEMTRRYPVKYLKEGYNTMTNGEEFYYISNPALGLWAYKERFELLK